MEELKELARQLKNKKAKEWRDKNKEKVKAIKERYWINLVKKQLKQKGE